MGDHRASIKIEFSMYGETKKANMWINWSPDNDQGVDRRVIEFFEDAANSMSAAYYEVQEHAAREYQKTVEEEAERKEFDRLKKKFETACAAIRARGNT